MKKLISLFILSILHQGLPTEAAPIAEKPFYDFFRKLIEKPRPKRRKRVVRTPIKKQVKKVIPPLQCQIMGISGEEGSRVAIIKFNNQVMLVEEGDTHKPHFKVIRIDPDKITFLHMAAGKRQEVSF